MPIVQQGSINTTALIVPDLYVQIVPPQVTLLNGVPTNVLGVVGTATWGPVNSPTLIGNMAMYAQAFGAIQNRTYDMGTAVAVVVQQGANNFRCVRVTDGTDTGNQHTLNKRGTGIWELKTVWRIGAAWCVIRVGNHSTAHRGHAWPSPCAMLTAVHRKPSSRST